MTPAAMNIHTCPICCPSCQLDQFRKHGCYTRKGFHSTEYGATVEVSVPRYRCLNPRCKRATFSILPAGVLRLCRFRWNDLLSVRQALAAGTSGRHLARVWHVGAAVIYRAQAELATMRAWIAPQHQELTNGKPARAFATMVMRVIGKIGRLELLRRWYCHRYPQRAFCHKTG